MAESNKKKVLLIEDDTYLMELLSLVFKKWKIDLDIAVDGEAGLARAKAGRPDLILLDLILPGIDGYEVLSKLKLDPELTNIPVVILSNLGQKHEIEKGKQLGAVDFLVKAKFDLEDIMVRVQQVLEKGR